ncbi:nuclear transport factor 2 family protein [Streptomyces ferrugineus]|uniref:Nuclear transport factor 2 family protein n=1 Tax=Streptomyces ferrugineus TaxID=1413221 RepID=A0A7M2SIX5_9ACTN|nr:nuclear transport factor 2 family protein [Streptomyces ferrugineus]QOV35695.1 nuclear transport factor 2 family protein [Streptomyces ferrugineus]
MSESVGTDSAAVAGGVRTLPQPVSGDLYAEVQTFYARQMRRVDALDIAGFADTFTEDGEVVHAGGQRQRGRAEMIAGMRANLPRYRDIAVRHWFDHLLIETDPADEDTLRVSYYTLVTQTDRDGKVSFQPTFTVEDVLVRRDGRLLTRSRVIHRDTPVEPPASAQTAG